MYSRAKDRPKAPIRLPDHYSGCAFREPPANPDTGAECSHCEPIPDPEIRDIPVTAAPCDRPPPPKTVPPAPPHVREDPPRSPAFFHPFEQAFGKMGSAFPFSHGLGFDELLILGLMMLLAQNERDPDLLILLGLLLFCG